MDSTLCAVVTDVLVAVNRGLGQSRPRLKKSGGLPVDRPGRVWLVLLRGFIGIMFTVRNAVLVALMQVGVIVAGVLAAGTSRRAWLAVNSSPVPDSVSQVLSYGPPALVIPLIWIVFVLLLRQRPEVSDDARTLAFYSGILIVVVLGVALGGAVLHPWLGADARGLGGAHED
jgi:hypothetical protein